MGDSETTKAEVVHTEDGPHGRYKRIGYDLPGHMPVTGVLSEVSALIQTSMPEGDYPHHVLVTKDGMSGQWRAWIRSGGAV